MGFESKIYSKENAQIYKGVQNILENQKSFYKKEIINDHLDFEFRESKISGGMLDITVIIEEDGLYICQYLSSKMWNVLNEIITFLKKNNIDFNIEEI